MFYHESTVDMDLPSSKQRNQNTRDDKQKSRKLTERQQRISSMDNDESRNSFKPNTLNRMGYIPQGAPLWHLKQKNALKYEGNVSAVIDHSDEIEIMLEVYNRKSVRKPKQPLANQRHIWLSESFFEDVGLANITFSLCSNCKDVGKNKEVLESYYVDMAEISQQRTTLCYPCMKEFLKENLRVELAELKDELKDLREAQISGIHIDPFLISCGY